MQTQAHTAITVNFGTDCCKQWKSNGKKSLAAMFFSFPWRKSTMP